jgi:hypothetical protein
MGDGTENIVELEDSVVSLLLFFKREMETHLKKLDQIEKLVEEVEKSTKRLKSAMAEAETWKDKAREDAESAF